MVTLVFVLIIISVAVGTAAYYVSRRDKEALLRLNPSPVVWLGCSLPGDFEDAETKMRTFYSKLTDICMTDAKLREQGLGVLHVAFYAEKQEGERVPEVRFLLGCHPEAVETVKTRLQSSFGLDLTVQSLKEAPLAEELEKARAAFPVQRPLQGLRDAWQARREARGARKAQKLPKKTL